MNLRSGARNVALSALMAALLIAGKFALQMIPNVEVVTIFILLFSCCFGLARTLPAVLVFCIVDPFLYGAVPTVLAQYFLHWPLLCVSAWLLSRVTKSEYAFLGLAAAASVLFWLETPVINVLFQFSPFMGTLVAGLPFFAINLISNGALVLVLFRPLSRVLEKVSNRLTL